MRVGIYLDFAGTDMMTVEEEYEDIKKQISEIVPKNTALDFIIDKHPHQWENQPYDLFILDYGGLMPGCSGLINSVLEAFIELVENRPNCLFIIWSSFTVAYYMQQMQKEYDMNSIPLHPNVRFAVGVDDSLMNILADWFNWTIVDEILDQDVKLTDPGRKIN